MRVILRQLSIWVAAAICLPLLGAVDENWLPVSRDAEDVPTIWEFAPIMPHVTIGGGRMSVTVSAQGAIQVDAGEDSYLLESCFSYPGTPRNPDGSIDWNGEIRWNGLPRGFNHPRYPDISPQRGPEATWQPEVSRVGDDTVRVEAAGEHYRLQRTIRVHEGRVDIEDTLTNLRAHPTSIVPRYGLTASEDFLERYSAGLEVPANPTVFCRGPRRSHGIVMQDNYSRSRLRPAMGEAMNHSGIQVNRLALDVGSSRTLSWSFYVMEPGQGYFDFINRVRDDWDANFTIDGPFSFGYLLPKDDDIKFYLLYSPREFYLNDVENDPTALREYLDWRGIEILAITPWLDHDPGAMDHVVTWDEYRQIMRRFVPAMRKVAPDLKIIACIETDWVAIRPDTMPNGDQIPLPDQTQKYGPSVIKTMTPDVSAIIEAGMPGWSDSIVRTAKGEFSVYHYYRGGAPINQLPLHVYPRVGNKRYDYMMQQIRLAIDELGMDGVYCDEFPLGQIGNVRSYGSWDGMSAENCFKTGELHGEYTDCGLAGVQARVDFINYVHDRGKVFVANRHCTSRDEQALPAFRFTETGSAVAEAAQTWEVGTRPPALNYLFFSHLNSPLGLGACGFPEGEDKVRWMVKVTIIYLAHGMIYYNYTMPEPDMTEANRDAYLLEQKLFPITPVELGQGFIVGKERILSAVSLDRLCDVDHEPSVMVFDINGKVVDARRRCRVRQENGQWRVRLDLDDWAEVAVVE